MSSSWNCGQVVKGILLGPKLNACNGNSPKGFLVDVMRTEETLDEY